MGIFLRFVLSDHNPYAMTVDAELCQVTLWPQVGSATMWDYRVLHYGRRNTTSTPRPVMYFAATKPWYHDNGNAFPSTISVFDDEPGQGDVPQPKRSSKAAAVAKLRKLTALGMLKKAHQDGEAPSCKQQ